MKKSILLFAILITFSQQLLAQTADKPETYFDFWVGKWQATWDEGEGKVGKATNHIHKTLDGKVIQENFVVLEGKSKGFKGMSLSVYNPRTKQWKQAWADNQGGYFDFTGSKEGDQRIFQTAMVKKDDKEIIQRMVFKEIKADSMIWDWEMSVDGGKTWKLNWRISYKKVEDVK